MDEQARQYLQAGGVLTNGRIPTTFAQTGGDLTTRPITSEALAPVPSVDFQTYQEPDIFDISKLQIPEMQLTQPEQQAQSLTESLQRLNQGLLGESQFRTEQEQAANIAGLTQTRQDLANRLKSLQAEQLSIPLQIQQESVGRGRTAGGVAPIQTARLRENAINALSTSAMLEAASGNLTTALSLVDRAVAQKYDPIKKAIEVTQANLNLVLQSPAFELADKKRAQEQLDARNAEAARIERAEADEKTIREYAVKAAEYGADALTLDAIQSARTPQEALVAAAGSITNPKLIAELENMRLDNELTKARISTERFQLQLLQEYGGLTPEQYRKKLEEDTKAVQTAKDDAERSRAQGQALNKQINLIQSVLNSDAIDSVVGPTAFSRAAGSPLGIAGRAASGFAVAAPVGAAAGAPFAGVGALPGAALFGAAGAITAAGQGIKDYFTGSSDKLIGQTEQFISDLFLKNLIDVKAQGATFGALQKAEQDALTASATFIGQRRVFAGKGEDKRIVGYDMSEQDYKREMENILRLTKLAYQRATGNAFAPEEQRLLDAAYSDGLSVVSGNAFYE